MGGVSSDMPTYRSLFLGSQPMKLADMPTCTITPKQYLMSAAFGGVRAGVPRKRFSYFATKPHGPNRPRRELEGDMNTRKFTKDVKQVPTDLIEPSPENPRGIVSEDASFERLVSSIAEVGILVP